MKAFIGLISAILAIILSIYILLLIFNVVPPMNIGMLEESFIRSTAQLTVFFYLVAAWAFWRI